jgi:general stress protein 26
MAADENIAKLQSLIEGIEVAMLTSIDAHGTVHARPMGTLETGADGTLWFFAKGNADRTIDLVHDRRVGVTYASRSKHAYVSLSGTATVTRDHDRIAALWQPGFERWFAGGKDDPDLVLIAIAVEAAEYWEAPAGIGTPVWQWSKQAPANR